MRDAESVKNLIDQNKDRQIIIIGTGADAANFMKENLVALGSNVKLIISSHQYSQSVKNLVGIADIIAVASHSITKEEIKEINNSSRSRYVRQIGASSSLTEKEIEESYKKFE